MATPSSDFEVGRPWRLGQVLDLGQWDSADELTNVRRAHSASAMITSRLLDLAGDEVVRLDEIAWKFPGNRRAGVLDLRATVTSRAQRAGRFGTFDLLLEAVGQDGAVVVQGECIVDLDDGALPTCDTSGTTNARFAGDPWVSVLVDRLREDARFAEATGSYDGSIGFGFGRCTWGMRIYRGRVIDQGRGVFKAATFGIAAPTHLWVEFARRPRNEFISFAMADRFEVSGSTYEYLRMTSAVMVVTDHVRELVRAELEEI